MIDPSKGAGFRYSEHSCRHNGKRDSVQSHIGSPEMHLTKSPYFGILYLYNSCQSKGNLGDCSRFVPFFKRQVENVALSKDDLIARLHKLFPEGLIYADQYLKQTGVLSLEIHKQAKASGQSRVQWLGEQGFVWRETGYVEPDMCYGSCTRPEAGADPFSIDELYVTGDDACYPPNTRNSTSGVRKLLNGSLLTPRKNTPCVIPSIEAWPRCPSG